MQAWSVMMTGTATLCAFVCIHTVRECVCFRVCPSYNPDKGVTAFVHLPQ